MGHTIGGIWSLVRAGFRIFFINLKCAWLLLHDRVGRHGEYERSDTGLERSFPKIFEKYLQARVSLGALTISKICH